MKAVTQLAGIVSAQGVEEAADRTLEYSLRDVDYGKGWFVCGPERGLLQVAAPTPV